MKRYIYLTGCCFFLCVNLFAQQLQLRVSTVNEKNELFTGATIAIYHLPDSILLEKKIVSDSTSFSVNKQTAYQLIVSFVGKQEKSTTVYVKDSSVKIVLTLKNNAADLSAITIVSKKPLITQEDDKTIVDASALTISSTNAFEVLEKTPGTIIDQDGNVYLTSTNPATVFINGREMKLSSSDLTSLLKSLPANSVSKIEILRSPSAKYDAASSGGILNIILKKGVKLGSNGSLNLAYFQGVYATQTVGCTFNKNGQKINSYINYQYTNRTNYEDLQSDRRFPIDSVIIHQQSFTKYPTLTHYVSTGIDYAFNKRFNIGYDLRVTNTKNSNTANNGVDISNESIGLLFGKNQSAVSNDNTSTYWSNVINTKYKIDSLGSEWTNSIEYSRFTFNNNQAYQNDYLLPAVRVVTGEGITNNEKNNASLQSDLVLKTANKYTIEVGVKAAMSNSDIQSDYLIDTGNHIKTIDLFQTNNYRYKEKINSAYIQLTKTIAGFTIKPGIRFESTDITGTQIFPKDTSFSIKRNDLFPYVFLKHKLFKMYGQSLMASVIFRKSIKRPYYETLNPYPKYVDQYLFDVGNPALKPQFTTNYEFNVTFNDIPVVALGINQTKDIFTNVIYQDEITKIAYRTYDNLGTNKEFYSRLIMGIPPGGKYFFYVGGLYNYNEYRGLYQGQPFHYNRGSFTFFTFHEYKATSTFTFNLQAFMRTKALQNFYELNTFGGVFVSANKSVLGKKANIILSINDLLHTNQVSFTYNQNNQNIIGTRVNDTRRIGLTLRYNFGIKPKEEKKPSYETPTETN